MRIELRSQKPISLHTQYSIQPDNITVIPVGETAYIHSNVSNLSWTPKEGSCGTTKLVVEVGPKLFAPTVQLTQGSNTIMVQDFSNGSFSQQRELINVAKPDDIIIIPQSSPGPRMQDYPNILTSPCYVSARCTGTGCVSSDWSIPVLCKW